jgi:hypothetical protein
LFFGILVAVEMAAAEEGQMKKLTPILIVDEIEPSLSFWVDRMGFQKTAEVPEGDKLGFVILVRDNMEVMYQTRTSIEKEVETAGLPQVMKTAEGPNVLYIEVTDLQDIRKRVERLDILVPHRDTFYGAEELWLREPRGHIIGFALLVGAK